MTQFSRATTGFWMGFWAPWRAARLIFSDSKLLGLAAVPFALNVALYALLFYWGAGKIQGLSSALMTWMAGWTPALLVTLAALLVKLVAWVTLVLVSVLSFTIVGSVLSAPFNDALCKRVYVLEKQEHLPGLPLPQAIRLELKRTLLLLSGGAVALVVGLIPLLQVPALALGAFLLAFEYFGYPMAQKEANLKQVFFFALRYPMVSLGFGSCLLLIMALPLMSIVYLPLAVVAGTSLFASLQKKGRSF